MFHACLFFFLSILIFLLYSTFAYRHHLLKLWLKHLHSRNSFTELVNLNWILLFQTGVFLHKITNNGVQCMLSQSIDSNSVLFFPIYSFILTVLCNFSIKCNMNIYIKEYENTLNNYWVKSCTILESKNRNTFTGVSKGPLNDTMFANPIGPTCLACGLLHKVGLKLGANQLV